MIARFAVKPRRLLVIGPVFLLLASCGGASRSIPAVTDAHRAVTPTPAAFTICHSHGCADFEKVGLSDEEWTSIASEFVPEATPAEERESIRRAIAKFERLVGAKTRTGQDKGGTFPGVGDGGQLDCVDEMANTKTYLTLLQSAGLLRQHVPAGRVATGFFEGSFWPHTASTIREKDSGARYVVESWLLDNGEPPLIVPVAEWTGGGWRKNIAQYQ